MYTFTFINSPSNAQRADSAFEYSLSRRDLIADMNADLGRLEGPALGHYGREIGYCEDCILELAQAIMRDLSAQVSTD